MGCASQRMAWEDIVWGFGIWVFTKFGVRGFRGRDLGFRDSGLEIYGVRFRSSGCVCVSIGPRWWSSLLSSGNYKMLPSSMVVEGPQSVGNPPRFVLAVGPGFYTGRPTYYQCCGPSFLQEHGIAYFQPTSRCIVLV